MKRPKPALRATADGAGQLQFRGKRRSAGEQEVAVLPRFLCEGVNLRLNGRNQILRQLVRILRALDRRRCHLAHDRHQIILDGMEQGVDRRRTFRQGGTFPEGLACPAGWMSGAGESSPNHAQMTIQFVERAVGLNPDVVFRDAVSPVNTGGSPIP